MAYIYFNTSTKTVIDLENSLEKYFQRFFNRINNQISEGFCWMIESIDHE